MLLPIYGLYEIIRGNKSECVIVMENMFFGMENWEMYDLKGTTCRKLSKFAQMPTDTNFLLDRNS